MAGADAHPALPEGNLKGLADNYRQFLMSRKSHPYQAAAAAGNI